MERFAWIGARTVTEAAAAASTTVAAVMTRPADAARSAEASVLNTDAAIR